MITKDNEDKLIEIYFYICEKFEKDLKYCPQDYTRFKNLTRNSPTYFNNFNLTPDPLYSVVSSDTLWQWLLEHQLCRQYLQQPHSSLPEKDGYSFRSSGR